MFISRDTRTLYTQAAPGVFRLEDAMQQQIQAAMQLAQQIGPQVLNDLGLKARDNKNDKLRKLLSKYGVEINDKAAASPAPSSSAPASTPAPAAPRLQ